MSARILFTINESEEVHYKRREFWSESTFVPRVGERVVRHVDNESSLINRFIVTDVTYVIETREWYLGRPEMCHDVVVSLTLEKR